MRRTLLTLPNGVSVEYGYDAGHQLTSLTYKLGATVLGNLTYTYDANGRRTTVGGSFSRTRLPQPVASATYNAANQLTVWSGTGFTYDLNGNTLTKGGQAFDWDARNRLDAIGGTTAANFQYDAFGRRTSKTIAGATTDPAPGDDVHRHACSMQTSPMAFSYPSCVLNGAWGKRPGCWHQLDQAAFQPQESA